MSKERWYFTGIIVVTIVVPLVVGLLFFGPGAVLEHNIDVSFLPALNAILNSSTALLLLIGLWLIKKKHVYAHRACMVSAFLLSALFLVSYLTYHASAEPTHFGGTGIIMYVYYFVLITHIILAAIIVPLVLITLYRAMQKQYNKHRRIARWTWPVWFYVAVTGVLVYLFLMPYY